ncbi:phage major capsid protein [Pseudonocardia sp. C8]|uniref:phage major capsid protein n=1 Tax=Pseudonocardia sp. C8 TaxID=2762759 RepID=UPI00164249AC|nr:phage major capsid protein [Pseudonocardia sp. C8]MBC3193838.1 phage major capsid protein [Pseudonocardia sp. C8]
MTTGNGSAIFSPEQVSALFVEPVIARAVATDPAVATVVRLKGPTWRAPRITADPSAGWVAEGGEIPVSDAALDEVVVVPSKVAGLTVVSSELLEDSDDVAAGVLGDGLTRDTARQLDTAFVGDGTAPNTPTGLAGVGYQEIVGGALVDLEAFARAAAAAENVGANITAWLCSSSMALRLAGLKDGDGSNRGLLQLDPAAPSRRIAEGRPIIVTPDVPADQVWGVDARRIFTILRTLDAEVTADASPYFSSDRVAVRSRLRGGFGFIHPESVVHITYSPAV